MCELNTFVPCLVSKRASESLNLADVVQRVAKTKGAGVGRAEQQHQGLGRRGERTAGRFFMSNECGEISGFLGVFFFFFTLSRCWRKVYFASRKVRVVSSLTSEIHLLNRNGTFPRSVK